MNETVKRAYEIQKEYCETENLREEYLPELEVGEVCEMNDVWDGEGDVPTESYSYKLSDIDYVNYEFEIVEENDNPLDTVSRITNIEIV